MLSLTGKTAVVTGSGSGQASSGLFTRQGAAVHILELNAAAGQQMAAEIQQAGRLLAHVRAVDVSQQAAVAAFQATGRDVLVNNADIAHVGNVKNTSEADFDRVHQVNVRGAYNRLFTTMPLMRV